MNPRFETVSANQFIVVDGKKRLAVLGLNPPQPSMQLKYSPAPELAALWFYDGLPYAGEPQEYRAIIGLEKNTSPAAATDEFLRYQPFLGFKMWEHPNSINYLKWP
jgi:hypothetical protein